MAKNVGFAIAFGVGMLLLVYSLKAYEDEESFLKNAIRADATVEFVTDEATTYGGMSKYGGRVYTSFKCDYTLKFLPERGQNYVLTRLKVFAPQCHFQGQPVAILYDPDNPQDIALFAGYYDATPLGKIGIILGSCFIAYTGICWYFMNLRRGS